MIVPLALLRAANLTRDGMTTIDGMTEHEASQRNGYLTTTGRVTRRAHEIEIWFTGEPESAGQIVYLLSGGRGRSDWVKNVGHDPAVTLRAAGVTYYGAARVVRPDEPVDSRARGGRDQVRRQACQLRTDQLGANVAVSRH